MVLEGFGKKTTYPSSVHKGVATWGGGGGGGGGMNNVSTLIFRFVVTK